MALIDTNLVVRYFVDEAASGITPTTVDDAGPATTQDLTIDYDAGTADLEYAEESGNRGLEFKDSAGDQHASIALGTSGKIYDAFNGTKVATLELVCRVTLFSGSGGRIFGIQRLDGSDGECIVRGTDATNGEIFQFAWQQVICRTFTISGNGRHVIHVVVDTAEATANDRIKVYVDGSVISPTVNANPTQNDTLLPSNDQLIAGNRLAGGNYARSFTGVWFYGALYSGAFSAQDCSDNYDILGPGGDDTGDTAPSGGAVVLIQNME